MPKEQEIKAVLQSTSDVLFPEELGEREVSMGSVSLSGDTPLHVTVERNDIYGATVLIAAGANINAQGEMNETPLHVAIRNKNLAIAEMLIQAGADLEIRSDFGETAREAAALTANQFLSLVKGQGGT